MEIDPLGPLDRRILRALVVAPRTSFREIGAVIGAPERVVARHYRGLVDSFGLRIAGRPVDDRPGTTTWMVRVRTTPDAAVPLAETLAARSDTIWVRLGSGGTELSCGLHDQTPAGGGGLLLDRLSAAGRVVDMSAHLILEVFSPTTWSWLTGALTDEEEALLAATHDGPMEGIREPPPIDTQDQPLVDLLSVDGRASAARLATETGWHESTVRRRVTQLISSGALQFDFDLHEQALGLDAAAQLWLSVDPGALEATGTEIATHHEAAFVAAVTGPTNLLVGVACRSAKHLYRYTTRSLGQISAIRSIESVPDARVFKRHAALPGTRS